MAVQYYIPQSKHETKLGDKYKFCKLDLHTVKPFSGHLI